MADLNRGFITDGDAAEIVMFDLKTLKTTGRIPGQPDADAILYDPASQRIFVFNGDPHSATVIDPAKGTVIATLPLGGAPEQAVADGAGMIYDNLEDKHLTANRRRASIARVADGGWRGLPHARSDFYREEIRRTGTLGV